MLANHLMCQPLQRSHELSDLEAGMAAEEELEHLGRQHLNEVLALHPQVLE